MRLAIWRDLPQQRENLRARERLFHHRPSGILDGNLRDIALGKHESGPVVGYKEVEKAIELAERAHIEYFGFDPPRALVLGAGTIGVPAALQRSISLNFRQPDV